MLATFVTHYSLDIYLINSILTFISIFGFVTYNHGFGFILIMIVVYWQIASERDLKKMPVNN